MNALLEIFILIFFASCASGVTKIEKEINAFEAKTLKEIKNHATIIIDSHPELGSQTKGKIKFYIQETLEKQQSLKDEESKIVQLLLSKSLAISNEKNQNHSGNQELKQRLLNIYQSKSENIFQLISNISKMSDEQELNESFKHDIQYLIRDFR